MHSTRLEKRKAIVIPARLASTRLPEKPLIEIQGKPLIQWVYESAAKSKLKDEIFVATDDEKIMEVVEKFGGNAVLTPKTCSSGTERVYEAIKDRELEIVVNVQGDEPFIKGDMIDSLFLEMEKEDLNMATLCSPVKEWSEYEDPNTVKVVLDRDGYALYFSRSPIPFFRDKIEQDIKKKIFKHIGVYGYKKDFLEKYMKMERGILEIAESLEQLRVLENGYRIKVLITDYDGFGIDTANDLERAESYLKRG